MSFCLHTAVQFMGGNTKCAGMGTFGGGVSGGTLELKEAYHLFFPLLRRQDSLEHGFLNLCEH